MGFRNLMTHQEEFGGPWTQQKLQVLSKEYHRILFKDSQHPRHDLTEFFAFGMKGFLLELQDQQFHEVIRTA
jgi:hypothetical protein